jgi:hypothetical protein
MPQPTLVRSSALIVALVIGGWLIFTGSPGRNRPAVAPDASPAAAQPSLREVWPGAVIAAAPGVLADGAQYSPLLYVDATTSVGVAPTPDGTAQRVVIRNGDRVRQVQQLAQDRFPRFLGFTSAGGQVYWVESTLTANQPLKHRLWRAPLRGDGAGELLTADTGTAVFQGNQHDLVAHEDRLYWAAVAADGLDTEVRSVPLAGGPVTATHVDGAYELSAWPWLQTVTGLRQNGRQELRSLLTGQRITIVKSATEIVDCSPVWCRSVVGTGRGTRYEVMRADGSQRRRVWGGDRDGDTFPAVTEVALLDRFEPVMQTRSRTAFDAAQQLALYDLATGRLVTVAGDVDQVMSGQQVLWWSTGQGPGGTWHSLDLSTLTG